VEAGLDRVGPGEFDGERLKRQGVVAVAFLADWCPFCRAFEPEFARLAERGIRLLVADVTPEESPLWERFQVEVVPTVVVFRSGQAVFRADGVPGRGLDAAALAAIAAASAPRTRGDRPSARKH
jgi:thioredoxin 1